MAASGSLISDSGLLLLLGGGAGALALVGMLLLVPLHVAHRREIARLQSWRDREPDAGTTEFRAVPPPGAAPAATTTSPRRMTPAERVTADRPALARITGEQPALVHEEPSFLRRVTERGPRHPLVLAIGAVLAAAAVIVVASQLIQASPGAGRGSGGGIDNGTVQVVVVNAAGSSGVAGDIAANLEADGFDVTANTVASSQSRKSSVRFAKGFKSGGKAVARSLGLRSPAPFNATATAEAAGADVVVVAGKNAQVVPADGKG